MSDSAAWEADDEIRRCRYVDELLRIHGSVGPRVERAFREVDRADFLSGFFVREGSKWTWLPVVQGELSQQASSWIYSNRALVTVIGINGMPASSSSMPGLMMAMLDALDVGEGMRILEIGTGTGYNAALLRSIVGNSGRVVSIESDPQLAAEAERRLGSAGFGDVVVVSGDGAEGSPATAPYDRLVATVGCAVVPDTWWEQLDSAGRALIPLAQGAAHPLTELRKGGEKGEWTGRYAGHARFMAATGSGIGARVDPGRGATIRLGPDVPVSEEELDCEPQRLDDLALFVALDIPEIRPLRLVGGGLGRRLIAGAGLAAADNGAAVVYGSKLYVGGAQPQAELLRRAIRRWHELGRPGPGQYTVRLGKPGASPTSRPDRSLIAWRSNRGPAEQLVTLAAEPAQTEAADHK